MKMSFFHIASLRLCPFIFVFIVGVVSESIPVDIIKVHFGHGARVGPHTILPWTVEDA